MSTTASFLRVGIHVVNLPAINHVWFDDSPWAEGEEDIACAFIDFGRPDNEGWDLVLTGEDAIALKAYFDREGEQ